MERRSRSPLLLLLLLVALAGSAAQLTDAKGDRRKFDSCFGCICEAATRCNKNLGCNNGVCGLFQITKPYWLDSGAPTLPGDAAYLNDAFERCTQDPFCALETVHRYMERYKKDCNSNGEVDCHDYALLHYLGPSCQGQLPPVYSQEFYNCRLNALLLSQQSD